MTELSQFLGWAFTGKAGNLPALLFQWWLRITALWLVLLVVVVAWVIVSALAQPAGDNLLMAYFTVEGAAALAMVGPALLAALLFVVYCVVYALIATALFFTTLLGV